MRRSSSLYLFTLSSCFLLASAGAGSAQNVQKSSNITSQLPAMAMPSSWTGFYAGVNLGIAGGAYQYKPTEVEAITAGEPEEPTLNRIRNTASGGLFGIQVGYLYQLPSNIVLGAEADFNWTNYRASGRMMEFSGEGQPETELAKTRLGDFGTLRARFGYAIGPVLPYITGGIAFGRTSYLFAEGEVEPGMPPLAKNGRTTWGYAVGAGLEYAITPALRLKTEYLYTALNQFQAAGLENERFKLGSNLSTVRVGLNYAFGQEASAFGARFPEPAEASASKPRFDGFSVGVTAGLAAGSSSAKTLQVEENETSGSSEGMNLAGGVLGVELGYHYAFQNGVIISAVADYQISNFNNEKIEAEQNVEESAKEKRRFSIPQFGTVRARAGYALGAFLPYVTAGLAYGRVEYRSVELPLEAEASPGRINQNKTGYTVGMGAEYALTSQLSFKAEYLYVDLGTIKGLNGAEGTIKASLPMNIGRVGLTYRF